MGRRQGPLIHRCLLERGACLVYCYDLSTDTYLEFSRKAVASDTGKGEENGNELVCVFRRRVQPRDGALRASDASQPQAL